MKITCKSVKKHMFRPLSALLEGLLDLLEEGWTLDFSKSPTDPLGGGLDLGLSKRANPGSKGGVQSDAHISPKRRARARLLLLMLLLVKQSMGGEWRGSCGSGGGEGDTFYDAKAER